MCTSFVHRKNDILVAMNFDNNGAKFELDTKKSTQFIVVVSTGRGKAPSFGVNCDGMFINHLLVDSNGEGAYKRASNKVTHTAKLVNNILDGTITADDLESYLQKMEVVNVPDYSAHNMISDKHGNVWVVEPGKGVLYSPKIESSYYVMTNFSLCDYKKTGLINGSGADRYSTAEKLLSKAEDLDVDGAFKILESVMQRDGEWITAFSMVYSQKERTVYYCFDGDIKKICKYSFGENS